MMELSAVTTILLVRHGLVGHDSVNRALLLQLLDQPLSAYWKLSQEPCAINAIALSPDGVMGVRMNETEHLRAQI
jgi:phosphoserine phosphatase